MVILMLMMILMLTIWTSLRWCRWFLGQPAGQRRPRDDDDLDEDDGGARFSKAIIGIIQLLAIDFILL